MDRSAWEKTLTCFQAAARGYLVRDQVRRAREDFEDIVREIEGRSSHVEWRETVVAVPRFTDTVGGFNRSFIVSESADRCLSLAPVLVRLQDGDVCPQSSSSSPSSSSGERGEHRVLQEKMEAERDDCDAAVRQRERQVEKDGDSTTVWSSLELDMNCGDSREAPRRSCTPEALRLHRNTLTMELVWLQQAIGSRKKYLSLKDGLSVS